MKNAIGEIQRQLTRACDHYEQTAPTAHAYFSRLFERIDTEPQTVALSELLFVETICVDGIYQTPNGVANQVYRLKTRLCMDTTGEIGY